MAGKESILSYEPRVRSSTVEGNMNPLPGEGENHDNNDIVKIVPGREGGRVFLDLITIVTVAGRN